MIMGLCCYLSSQNSLHYDDVCDQAACLCVYICMQEMLKYIDEKDVVYPGVKVCHVQYMCVVPKANSMDTYTWIDIVQ